MLCCTRVHAGYVQATDMTTVLGAGLRAIIGLDFSILMILIHIESVHVTCLYCGSVSAVYFYDTNCHFWGGFVRKIFTSRGIQS